jgi:hypothetical protein
MLDPRVPLLHRAALHELAQHLQRIPLMLDHSVIQHERDAP